MSMNISTFNEDLLNLEPYADKLLRFIEVERQFVDNSLVIAISSGFGSGKTTFLNMWKAKIESLKKEREVPFVISLNAWESDYYGDPLFAIISGLVNCIQQSGKSAESIIDAAKDIGWFATAIASQIVQNFTGIDPVAAGEHAEKKKAERAGPALALGDTFSAYQGRKDAMGKLKYSVQQFVDSVKPMVLFIVDELDRCRPDYAISYLETIKHIFDVKGAVFILAADRKQLENSSMMAFGANLDFDEYYRKFVHREVSLPRISDACYMRLAEYYVPYYIKRAGVRSSIVNFENNFMGYATRLIGALKLTPRQIQETFRILGHILTRPDGIDGELRWNLAVGTIAMAAFKVGRPRVYHLLGSQLYEPDEAYKFLSGLLPNDSPERWFTIFLTGGGLKLGKSDTEESVLIKYGILKKDDETGHHKYLSPFHLAWGHSSSSRFVQIYDMIEHIMQWN